MAADADTDPIAGDVITPDEANDAAAALLESPTIATITRALQYAEKGETHDSITANLADAARLARELADQCDAIARRVTP